MKKFVKIFVISSVLLVLFSFIFLGGYILSTFLKYKDIKLNTEVLSTPTLSIPIYDKDNQLLNEKSSLSSKNISLKQVPPHLYNAFISIEDKDFYTHKGINPTRIITATIQNLKNKSFSQGASTISQQLIKNTHLSSEKTIERKIKEIILTKKMEKVLDKNEILETYLNVIYFGNNCYGISSASQYYFSKKCDELTLDESALLAGIIKSPNLYSPITHSDKCLKRRNLVLSEMFKDGKITEIEYQKAKERPIELKISSNKGNNLNSYSEYCIDEAKNILHLPAKQIALAEYKIYTYLDKNLQEKLTNSLQTTDFETNDYAGLIIDNKTHGISAFNGKSNFKILDAKRQPGSCIKPLLVYAPAINEDIITPETQILDEKIKIGEYEPENVNKKFNGYVSVKDAVAKSINIPAIKVLSYVGIEKGKKYAEQIGIKFDKNDNNYALALGGMTYGTDLKTLCSAYSTFANNGKFSEGKFISHITTKDGKILYKHLPTEKQVFREDTSYLMTEILQETSKIGTAKKLSDLNINLATKTGTAGNKNGNTDAWNISYTPSFTIGVWSGKMDNSTSKISGGNQPTEIIKKTLKNFKNEDFSKPSSIVNRPINTIDLADSHTLKLAQQETPDRFKKDVNFSIFNLPQYSNLFVDKPTPNYKIKEINGQKNLVINAEKYLIYELYSDKNLIEKISEKKGEITLPINQKNLSLHTRYINSSTFTETKLS